MPHSTQQRLNRVYLVLRKIASEDIEVVDKSTHPTVLDYAVVYMQKGKSPSVAAKLTAEKLSGGTNYFLGNGVVSIDPKVLEDALWDRMANDVITAMPKFKEGKEDFALGGTLDLYGQAKGPMRTINPKQEAELRKRVVKKLGRDPFPRTASFKPDLHWVEQKFREYTKEMWGENTYEKLKDRLTFVRGELKGNHLAAVVYAGNPRVIGDHIVVYANKYTVLVTDRFLALSDQKQAEGVLRHEVIHLGHRGHGREFREMAHRFGAPISEEASAGGGVKIQVKDGARYKTVEEIHDKSFDEVARWLRREHVRPESPYYQKRVRISQ